MNSTENQSPEPHLEARRGEVPVAALAVALAGLALLTVVVGAFERPFWDPDEGRNAEVAREMAQENDFIVPHLNGLPYLDKPVFHFAASALSIKVLGATEFGARFPSLLFTFLTAILLVAFGCHLFGKEVGFLAGLAFAASPLVIGYSGIVIFDCTFAFWVACSLAASYLAWERDSRGWWVAAWASTGFAVLTKGPVGLAIPLVVNVAYALARRGGFRRLFHPRGIFVFLVVTLSWFLAVTARHPEFPHYAFVLETFQRVSTAKLGRTGPIYYFIPFLLGGALPWSLLLVVGAPRLWRLGSERRGRERPVLFLLIWLIVPFLLFSISQSKRPGYMLPLFPPLALLAARLFREPSVRRWWAWLMAAVAAICGAVLLLFAGDLASLTHKEPGLPEMLGSLFPLLGLLCIALAAAAALGARRDMPRVTLAALALLPVCGLLAGQHIAARAAQNRSAWPLVEPIRAAIRARAPASVRLVAVHTLPHSLSYYLGSSILVSTATATELRSNYIKAYEEQLREEPGSTLRPADWWREALRNCRVPTVFIVRKRDIDRFGDLKAHLPLLAESPRYVAYGPCREKQQ